jgi:hypothetical protein
MSHVQHLVESLRVTSLTTPAAAYTGAVALAKNCQAEEAYERAFREFVDAVQDGEEIEDAAMALWTDLQPFGFTQEDMRWHVDNFPKRQCVGHVDCADLC